MWDRTRVIVSASITTAPATNTSCPTTSSTVALGASGATFGRSSGGSTSRSPITPSEIAASTTARRTLP